MRDPLPGSSICLNEEKSRLFDSCGCPLLHQFLGQCIINTSLYLCCGSIGVPLAFHLQFSFLLRLVFHWLFFFVPVGPHCLSNLVERVGYGHLVPLFDQKIRPKRPSWIDLEPGLGSSPLLCAREKMNVVDTQPQEFIGSQNQEKMARKERHGGTGWRHGVMHAATIMYIVQRPFWVHQMPR